MLELVDEVYVEVSADGVNFDIIRILSPNSLSERPYVFTNDIAQYISANTTVRFRVKDHLRGADEWLQIHQVSVFAEVCHRKLLCIHVHT